MVPASFLRHLPAMAAVLAVVAACSPEQLTSNATLPPNEPNPASTHTPSGALDAYNGVLVKFAHAFAGDEDGADYVTVSGMLADELSSPALPGNLGVYGHGMHEDSRVLPEYNNWALEPDAPYVETYSLLNDVRGNANEALGLLRTYAPDAPPAMQGHLDAIEGYSEIFLGELYCSGIPLSTVDFNGDYTLHPGSSTSAVLQAAVALFDSAMTLGADSARILNLARVGKARALLDLGEPAQAANVAALVPDGYQYQVLYQGFVNGSGTGANFAGYLPGFSSPNFSVSDREGGNGLDYISSNDPRTTVTDGPTNGSGVTLYVPDKYASTGDSPVVLADWIEARLIQAEAALAAGDVTTWLATLNHLRETAISPALPDTTDPGTDAGRVDLQFRERAFWLFLTGHRDGDMRRLIRQYGRNPEAVYPVGPYLGGPGAYGTDVTAPIPAGERAFNPLFTGCVSRRA